MTLKDLQDLINQEISKKDKVKTVRKFAVGIGIAAAGGLVAGILIAQKSGKETREDLKKKTGNTIESVRDRVKKKAEAVYGSATYAAQGACDVAEDVHAQTEGVKEDIRNGGCKITQDLHKTAENITNEFNDSVE
jgi:gas vesicle protein